jgi:hypothetical protein
MPTTTRFVPSVRFADDAENKEYTCESSDKSGKSYGLVCMPMNVCIYVSYGALYLHTFLSTPWVCTWVSCVHVRLYVRVYVCMYVCVCVYI